MSKWEMVRLGDVCLLITKGTTPTTLGCPFEEHGINFIKIESISEYGCFLKEKFQYISPECNQKLKRSQLKERDILFSIAGALGRTAIVTNDILPANINQALAIIRLNDTALDAQFIVKVLNSNSVYEQFQKQKQGVAQLNLSLKNVSDLQIPLPPLAEQKKIAAELDKISGLIAKRKSQIEKLDLLVKAKFVDMFGDPVTNPMEWEVKALANTAKILTGNTPPRNDANNYGSYIEWIKTDNITDQMFLTPANEYLSEQGYQIGRYVEQGAILMACIAGSIKSIGRVAVTDRKVAFNQQINAIVPLSYSTLFLYVLFIQAQSYLQSTINMSLKGILSKGRLEQLEFIIPPLSLQAQFADFVQKVEQTKSTMRKSLVGLETLYKARMQEYFE